MAGLQGLLGGVLRANNARVALADDHQPNPRPLDDVTWHHELRRRFSAIQQEWDDFVAAGGRLPRIEAVLDEHQGNEGSWRAGLLVTVGRRVAPLADRFPDTVEALDLVPGLLSALWSVLEPGTELPAHVGPNAGVLRYHLTVRGDGGAALQVADTVVPYTEGEAVLFEDTVAHSAWNRGATHRVTLFCEILRPLAGPAAVVNGAAQRLLALDGRYRRAPRRAAEWHRALNPDPTVSSGSS